MLSINRVSCVKPQILKSFCRCVNREAFSRRVTDPRIENLKDRLIFCEHLDHQKLRLGYMARKILSIKERIREQRQKQKVLADQPVYSVLLNNVNKENNTEELEEAEDLDVDTTEPKPIHMPYAHVDSYESVESTKKGAKENKERESNLLNNEYKVLYEKYLDAKRRAWQDETKVSFHKYVRSDHGPAKVPANWMTAYEQFNDSLMEDAWQGSYGTPQPNSKVSHIPCGGCGALLHCKDPALPGYLPSEIYPSKAIESLKLMTCQRCHFLKFYKTALEVKVSADEYPELLKAIKHKKCAVILIVDLTDFPCSIWPDLKSVLHPMTPIFLVGNKVDLLPQDSPNYLEYIKRQLVTAVKNVTRVDQNAIRHVSLLSAKTAYGIEEFINKLHNLWRYKGDVYLIGCTNVGKSTLFNALLRSDYCKSQAMDLIQRATTSPWPGTTLNLLKFPILNPVRHKLYLRTERLRAEQEFVHAEKEFRDKKFKDTGRMKHATLTGHVGRTFYKKSPTKTENDDLFAETSHRQNTGKCGLDETQEEYANCRWCYDTPGTIYRDQVLDLLTTDELLVTLPRAIISPRSFVFKPGQTMFLGGLGRIDYVEGTREAMENKSESMEESEEVTEDGAEEVEQEEEEYMRCTVFASKDLPITICHTVDADELYEKLLMTTAFVVPTNNPKRLRLWPRMSSVEMTVSGINEQVSAADVVLSSAGWVAITPHEMHTVTLRAWTPEGRGLHLRTPALLRKSITLRGKRVPYTPMYRPGRQTYRPRMG